jgi:hypothetical protein
MSRHWKSAALFGVLFAAAHFAILSWSWSSWQSNFQNYAFAFAVNKGLTKEGGGIDPVLFAHPEFQPPRQSKLWQLLAFPVVNYSISANGGEPTLIARIVQSILWGFIGIWAILAIREWMPKRP